MSRLSLVILAIPLLAFSLPVLASPIAAFTGNASSIPGQTVSFNGSSSSDSGASIDSYMWTFGDGSPVFSSTSPTASHTYSIFGDYNVMLTVMDTLGASNSVSHSLVVDTRPVANVGGPYTVTPGAIVTLNASGSFDADAAQGDSIRYAWDLTMNGLFNDSTSPTPRFTAPVNASVGTAYSVCGRVTDTLGESSTACSTVTVSAASTPEPSTFLVFGVGLGLVAVGRKGSRRSQTKNSQTRTR